MMQKQQFLFFFSTLCILFLSVTQIQAQTKPIIGLKQQIKSAAVDQEIQAYEIYQFDAAPMHTDLLSKGGLGNLVLELGNHHWNIILEPSNVIAENYQLKVLTDKGIEVYGKTYEKAFKGFELNGGGNVRMTMDHGYLSGYVQEGKKRYFIEPLYQYDLNAAKNLFVVYEASDVIENQNATCTEHHAPQEHGSGDMHIVQDDQSSNKQQICLDLQLAIASDKSMFTKYGSVTAVENHNITVINNVEVNYTGVFIHDINYVIVTQFVVTGTDPWSNTLNAGDLLDEFTAWGPGNFGTTHDLGELWTNRDFTGSTIGIAWVSALCTSFKYHALQDFSTNQQSLRVMTAHEIGHNLSLNHDSGSGFIMSPSVSTTNTWSAGSISGLNNYLPGKINANCLVACAGGGGGTPPTAGFTVNPTTACVNQTITLTNTSTGSPTSYSWSMPGGTPASSTATNPTVSYATPGTKTISLTATNASGSNTTTQTVTVIAAPTATFTYSVNGTTVSFTYTGSGATSWTWNFGNGNTSTVANPVHTYANSGTFTVTLVVNGPCGTAQSNQTVITAPNANFSANPTTGCAPLTVNFTNLTTGATSYLWTFTGGTPNQSTAVNPLITYSAPGTYDVTLIATNASGSNSETKFGYIVVGGAPTSSFDANPVGTFVTFTNTSMGATSYSWNFGDGNTSTQASPTHTYASQGTYTVTLIATNNCGSVTSTQTLQIFNAPVASFTFNPASGCYPLIVNYQSTSSGANLAYSWQFPGGTPSSSDLPSPTVTYNSPGTYSATLVVSNPSGSNTTSTNNSIQVNGPPATAFSLSQQGATVQFTNTTTGGNSFVWDFGNGATSTQTNPTYTYTQDGTYTITLISTNACGPAGYSETVTVVSPPAAAISASQSTGCTPFGVQFAGQSSSGVTYSWSFPGGTPASSSAQNPSVTYNAAGSFTATLTVSNAAGTASAQQTITVGSGTTPGFNFSTSGLTANFNNTSANATTYLWEFGDGNTSTAVSPSYTYAQDGAYTVTLNATNACGTNTSTLTVVIATPPTAGFATSATSGCTPFNVQFTNQSSSNAANLNWSFSGGSISSSTSPNPSVTFSTPGTYTATLTVSNSAGSNTSTQTITVGAGASPGFTQSVSGALASFTNTSSGANSYAWAFGDGQTSTQASPTHTYSQDGTYTVTLTANNACGGSTTTQTVVIVTPPSANFATSSTNGCSPFTVQFNNQSSANATGYAWTFAGGNPATSTDPSPVVVYATPGTYSVVLTTSNAAGSATETKSNYITVGATPVPQFTSAVSGLAVNFTNTSTNANAYTWAFGDGQTSTSASPSHTYAQDGVYTVTMTASNSCGSSTSTQTVVISTPPSANFASTSTSGCAPLTVQYTNQSSANATGFAWTFAGGTPATSTDPNPTVVYATPGTYSVVLTTSNAAGSATETKSNYITVGATPVPQFTSAVSGLTINFTNTSTNANAYTWAFGDGQTSTSASPSHTYAQDGVYTVTMTASNACGNSTSTQTVVIVTPPSANFASTTTSGCSPLTVQYNNQSSANATGFAWTFEGGTPATSTDPNPVVVYLTPGNYGVTLTSSNAAGSATQAKPNFVQVNTIPTADFIPVSLGANANFQNQSTNATSYLWDFGDGQTSTDLNATHQYATDGFYTVVLTATNACGSTSTSQVINIVLPPTASFTMSGQSGCAPYNVAFTNASSANATTYAWVFEGGTPATSNAPNPLVVWNTGGLYTVSLTVTNATGSDTYSQFVTVNTLPVSGFTVTQGGLEIGLNNTTVGATSYAWSFGDGGVSTLANPTHTYALAGTYTVILTAINGCGSVTSEQTVTISGTAPTPAYTASSNIGCAPQTIEFNDASIGNPTSWSWTFVGGTPSSSTSPNPVVVYNQTGSFDVSLTVTNPFGTQTQTWQQAIAIGQSPTASFSYTTQNGTVTFTNTSSAGAQSTWSFGDGTTSSDLNPVHTYSTPGTYIVILNASNDCGSAVLQQTINLSFVDVQTPAWVNRLVVMPNPASTQFDVQLEAAPQAELQMQLFDVLGREITRKVADFGTGFSQTTWDATDLSPATYFLRISNGKESVVVPVAIVK